MKNLRTYFLALVIYWTVLAVLLILYGYKDSFLLLNHLNIPALDYILYVLTWFGDSLFIAALIILAFPRRTAMLLMTILCISITGLFAQALKQWIFSGWDRPLKVFENTSLVHTIGKYHLFHRSFPSGHSVTTATAFTLLAWYLRDKKAWVLLSAFMAIIVSYTRIYTGTHFAGDVLAGSITGTLLCIGLIYLFKDKLESWVKQWNKKEEWRVRIILQVIAIAGLIFSIVKYLEYL